MEQAALVPPPLYLMYLPSETPLAQQGHSATSEATVTLQVPAAAELCARRWVSPPPEDAGSGARCPGLLRVPCASIVPKVWDFCSGGPGACLGHRSQGQRVLGQSEELPTPRSSSCCWGESAAAPHPGLEGPTQARGAQGGSPAKNRRL